PSWSAWSLKALSARPTTPASARSSSMKKVRIAIENRGLHRYAGTRRKLPGSRNSHTRTLYGSEPGGREAEIVMGYHHKPRNGRRLALAAALACLAAAPALA